MSEEYRALSTDKIKPISTFPLPQTLKHLRVFLGITGFYRLWIPGFEEIAHPLHQLVKDTQAGNTQVLKWEPEAQKGFEQLKRALLQAPAISFSMGTSFNLYGTEWNGMALGVLTQTQGPAQQTVVYLSKELDIVVKGWPARLQAVAVVALFYS